MLQQKAVVRGKIKYYGDVLREKCVKIQKKRPGLSWLVKASTLALSVPADPGIKFAEDIDKCSI